MSLHKLKDMFDFKDPKNYDFKYAHLVIEDYASPNESVDFGYGAIVLP